MNELQKQRKLAMKYVRQRPEDVPLFEQGVKHPKAEHFFGTDGFRAEHIDNVWEDPKTGRRTKKPHLQKIGMGDARL